jgi:16S rRNA (guanine966-N2)-methyltransferase
MVECEASVAQCLRDNRQRLGADMVEVVEQDALDYLRAAPRAYEIVFLDPPFAAQRTLRAAMHHLAESGSLAAGARIYVEASATQQPLDAPPGCKLLKSKRAGQVAFQLYGYADE